MKRLRNYATIFCLVMPASALAELVTFTGTIGPYAIEVELQSVESDKENLIGRYRYEGRKSWLDLKGHFHSNQALSLIETWEGKASGRFFLEQNEGTLQGRWVAADDDLQVELKPITGPIWGLYEKPDEDEISSVLQGTYRSEFYWVNDWFEPNYEIGFNGGDVIVRALGEDELHIWFSFVVGPTYHIAYFDGVAKRTGSNVYETSHASYDDDAACHLTLTFRERAMSIEQHSRGISCGFGARAHANFDLEKVNDQTPKPPEW